MKYEVRLKSQSSLLGVSMGRFRVIMLCFISRHFACDECRLSRQNVAAASYYVIDIVPRQTKERRFHFGPPPPQRRVLFGKSSVP